MRIIVINTGSSSLKCDLLEARPGAGGESSTGVPGVTLLAHIAVERIGQEEPVLTCRPAGTSGDKHPVGVKDHREAVVAAFDCLDGLPGNHPLNATVAAVGHRVVHGGDKYVQPTRIDDTVIAGLDELSEIAPLHNPKAVQGIRAAREALGTGMPMYAVFDTAFHSTMPPYASLYALPAEMAERYKVRRYGFQGIAHEYMLRRYAAITGTSLDDTNIITLQLGNGCSAAAISGGKSVDTSMGFTPLEGFVMGTRSGDIDPSVVSYLARKEGITADDVELMLNQRSGMLGVSGQWSDMRDLLQESAGSPRAALAVQMFCYRARKYVGAYMAALNGTRALVFGGGIGENAPEVRARICQGMEWCGVQLDPKANEAAVGTEARISAEGSKVAVYVVPVDEAALIAQRVAECMVAS